jgi:hypothetical protein
MVADGMQMCFLPVQLVIGYKLPAIKTNTLIYDKILQFSHRWARLLHVGYLLPTYSTQ